MQAKARTEEAKQAALVAEQRLVEERTEGAKCGPAPPNPWSPLVVHQQVSAPRALRSVAAVRRDWLRRRSPFGLCSVCVALSLCAVHPMQFYDNLANGPRLQARERGERHEGQGARCAACDRHGRGAEGRSRRPR